MIVFYKVLFYARYGDLQCRNCGQFLSTRWAVIHKCNVMTALYHNKYDTIAFEDIGKTYQKYVAKNQMSLSLENGELVYNNQVSFKKLMKRANKCLSECSGNSKKNYTSHFIVLLLVFYQVFSYDSLRCVEIPRTRLYQLSLQFL